MEVGIPIYIIACLSFFGWIVFSVYGGVGLISLPHKLITDFINRPKIRKAVDMIQLRKDLKEESEKLITMGQTVKSLQSSAETSTGFWEKRKIQAEAKKEENTFKAAVLDFEKEHDRFKEELQMENSNPLVYIGKLLAGIFFSLLSFTWILHMYYYPYDRLLYVLPSAGNKPPTAQFLNSFLNSLESSGITPLATGFLMFMSLYLLGCTINGFFIFGVKVPFLFSIHTMKANETWMNSFLFNILVILMTTSPLLQFLLKSFRDYARLTELANIFGVQINYLRFFRFFFMYGIFEILLMGFAVLFLAYIVLKGCCIALKNKITK